MYPKIDASLAAKLGVPVSMAEAQDAIRQTQNGKSPSPDRFIVECYKAHSNLVSPLLVSVRNEPFTNG